MLDGKTYWIVGASEGLGRALAEEMDAAGAKLILSARSQDRLEALAGALKHTARAVPCDVTSSDSVLAAWQSVGDIDGVIYMAGAYEPMRAQDWNGDDVARICEVNFTGATRILSHVVPSFTKRGAGHIVIVGSLAGYRGLPGAIGYGASKAAIMHLAETLEADLWHTPVRVQLFNPGFIRTRLTDKNQFSMPFLMEPEEAAKHMINGLRKDRFQFDFPWIFSLFFRLGRFLPSPLFYRMFAPKPK